MYICEPETCCKGEAAVALARSGRSGYLEKNLVGARGKVKIMIIIINTG